MQLKPCESRKRNKYVHGKDAQDESEYINLFTHPQSHDVRLRNALIHSHSDKPDKGGHAISNRLWQNKVQLTQGIQ